MTLPGKGRYEHKPRQSTNTNNLFNETKTPEVKTPPPETKENKDAKTPPQTLQTPRFGS